jgi:hypothetical protein
VIPDCQQAKSTLELHPADAEFFLKHQDRLPGSIEENAVTLELNRCATLRAKTCDSPVPVEIVLANSSKAGEDVTVCLNRGNLVRVAQMGFGRLYSFGQKDGVLARDDSRAYFFMPLIEQDPVRAKSDCLRIESPVAAQPTSSQTHSVPPSPVPMVTPNTNSAEAPSAAEQPAPSVGPVTDHASAPRRRRRAAKSGTSVLDQALSLRDQLRTALTSTKDLIRLLKAERRSQKSLQLALDSLKQLRTAA